MIKKGKTVLAVFSILSFLSVAFFGIVYYFSGLSYLYYSQEVVNAVYIAFAVAILLLAFLITAIVLMFRGKKAVRILCAVLLMISIPVALFGSFVGMLAFVVVGPNGCSYTEDIANYGKYDNEYSFSYFPEAITEDMTVTHFAYFCKYADALQRDLYLEVKFENQETMDAYLEAARNTLSEEGTIEYPNPYDPKYTDIVEERWVSYGDQERLVRYFIGFGGEEDYRYVSMHYPAVTYSYENLTIIYNYTDLGSDIAVGNRPDKGEYYPQFLERFGVTWNPDNEFYSPKKTREGQ